MTTREFVELINFLEEPMKGFGYFEVPVDDIVMVRDELKKALEAGRQAYFRDAAEHGVDPIEFPDDDLKNACEAFGVDWKD